ncbi:MAG: glycosyltransferase family 2 protein [Clostridia bacterium]|nr:glycosyltransferase family 2 protein [Clostridia bacterium]
MKLIIQIPCYNEEENLAKVIDELPTKIDGIEKIEYMVINDGSTDKTREIAIEKKVNYIVDIFPNKGLANTFMTGIDECLKNGADIIVNIDGDHQYSGKDIPKLIEPIINGHADIVIGERQIEKFSPVKRFLQKLGSFFVRLLSKTKVPDAPSGFRAYSREYALKLNVYNQFTYTLETIIQAGSNKEKIETIKIESFPNTRKSRLFKNIPQYIYKSTSNVIKALFIYKPIRIWAIASFIAFILAILSFMFLGTNAILPYACSIVTIQFAIASMQSISIQANRKQLEKLQYYIKKERFDKNGE